MNYKLLARWTNGNVGLVTMGKSLHDCLRRIPYATSQWTTDDLLDLEEYWVERWNDSKRCPGWKPVETIDAKYIYPKHRFSRPILDRERRRNLKKEQSAKINFVLKG